MHARLVMDCLDQNYPGPTGREQSEKLKVDLEVHAHTMQMLLPLRSVCFLLVSILPVGVYSLFKKEINQRASAMQLRRTIL